jgi:hypothetical protein
MAACTVCGQEIEIRWVGGRLTPIHPYGGCSVSGHGGASSAKPFRSIFSYINPNAYCPVCGEPVYYYQSPHGGRVFFDDLGWPWPKHSCTDTKQAQEAQVRETERRNRGTLWIKNNDGVRLKLFVLEQAHRRGNDVRVQFLTIPDRRSYHAIILLSDMQMADITIDDLKDAPSFLIAEGIKGQPKRNVEFISVRHSSIVRLTSYRAG